jgi:hypothetical protein
LIGHQLRHAARGLPYRDVLAVVGTAVLTTGVLVSASALSKLDAGTPVDVVNSGARGGTGAVTIVETVSERLPAGGWTDLSGQRNGDRGAWIPHP